MKLSGAEQSVLQWIDSNQAYLVGLLQELVRIPSVYPEEGEAQAFVGRTMTSICDALDVWEPDASLLDAHPAYFVKGQSFKNRPNIVGTIKGRGTGRSLLLNAHIDVVPPQPDKEWPYGPWSGALVDGKIYGRGSLDDKSGVALMISVAKAIRECGVQLKGDLQLHSVVDEEWGGAGTLACMQRGHVADAGIILEPCGPDIYPASRGGQAFRITVKGKGAHPGASWKGVSAIDKAILIIKELKIFESERQIRWRTPLFEEYPIFAPIVIGKISGDLIPSKVPEQCIFEGLYGYPAQEHWTAARRAFEERVASAAMQDPWLKDHAPLVEWHGLNKEGAEIPADHPVVLCAKQAISDASGIIPRITGEPAGTDLPLLVLYGPVPSFLYGVEGDASDSHSSTEKVEVKNLMVAARCLALTVMRWCGVKE
jgi:acetylornithine deacetylase